MALTPAELKRKAIYERIDKLDPDVDYYEIEWLKSDIQDTLTEEEKAEDYAFQMSNFNDAMLKEFNDQ